ncbi:MAG: endonuclease dU [Candidatus Bathyarchaeia archaeon]
MSPKRFRSIKPEIRVLGIDDGGFVPRTKGTVDVVGVVYRGGQWFEGVMKTKITLDGLDATEKMATMIKGSSFCGEIRVIVLDGVTFAGFNVVDISELSSRLNLPVISVVREKPDLENIKNALKNLQDFEVRWQAMENAGELFTVETKEGENPVYMHTAGILREDAEKVMRVTSTRSLIPEALRIAHIASGLSSSSENI